VDEGKLGKDHPSVAVCIDEATGPAGALMPVEPDPEPEQPDTMKAATTRKAVLFFKNSVPLLIIVLLSCLPISAFV
jgi:hypothetical protein